MGIFTRKKNKIIKSVDNQLVDGAEILIAMRNKNMGDAGIWLYDVCYYVGGDITDNDNWEGKNNWETPLYWTYINEPKKNYCNIV